MGNLLITLSTLVWPLFVAATILMGLIWISGFGVGSLADPDMARRIPNAELRSALASLARAIDPIWITLAAVHIYLGVCRAEGIHAARVWCGSVLVAGSLISAVSATFSLPLGPIHYPGNLGWKIGHVPFAVPFLWMVMVVGARETVLRLVPKLSHTVLAVLAGVVAAGAMWLIEPLPWKYRAWWLWYPGPGGGPDVPPWTNYLTWLIAAGLLAYLMRPTMVVPRLNRRPLGAVAALASLVVIALITRAVR